VGEEEEVVVVAVVVVEVEEEEGLHLEMSPLCYCAILSRPSPTGSLGHLRDLPKMTVPAKYLEAHLSACPI